MIAVHAEDTETLLSPDELTARLRQVGEARYHHKHPFHIRMHEGKLTRRQFQAWALNRYYYQSKIPIKDALILARTDDASFRRAWRKRIVDHDGSDTQRGGIEKWVRLAEATGLDAEQRRSARAKCCPLCATPWTLISIWFRKSVSSKPSPPRSPRCSRAI